MLISFGLVLVLSVDLTTRLGSQGKGANDVPVVATDENEQSAIWLSVTASDTAIVVSSDDRRSFSWPLTEQSLEGTGEFVSYLKSRVSREIDNAGLGGEVLRSRLRVTLAVDQRLNYWHIRPLIYALAEANVTNYAFQTRLPPGSVAISTTPEGAAHE